MPFAISSFSSIHLAKNDIHTAKNDHRIGNRLAKAHVLQHRQVNQAGRTNAIPIWVRAAIANEVKTKLRKAGVRVEVDERSEKIGKKIREAELNRVPYMLIIGEKEMNERKLSVRRQGRGDTGVIDVSEFINMITVEIMERKAAE